MDYGVNMEDSDWDRRKSKSKRTKLTTPETEVIVIHNFRNIKVNPSISI